MKNHFVSKFFVAFFSASLFLTSCNDLGTVTPTPTKPPTVTLGTGTGITSKDATISASADFVVNVLGAKGDSPLKAISVQEAGTNVPLERIKINGVAASSNPILLFNTDKTNLDYKISVKTHADISTKVYAFIVEDEAAKKTSQSLSITTVGLPATIELKTADSLGIAPNSLFSSTFKVTKGSSALKTVEVQENGVKITDLSRLFYDKLTVPFTANPQTIATDDKETFNKAIIINSPATAGKYVYTFIFTDELGISKSTKITVIVAASVELIAGALLNSAGPDGTGGLDLDTGKGTGSTSATAKIRDEGIDLGEALAANWKQQVSGVNGSVIKYIVKGQNGVPATFSFTAVNTKAELADLFTKGVDFTQKNGTRLISNKVSVGDILIVQNGTKYYLLNIKTVTITKADNDDQYVIDIKK